MKEDIRRIIEDLQHACVQPLFNGIAGSSHPAAAGAGSLSLSSSSPQHLQQHYRPASKRPRREQGKPSTNDKGWDSILAEASTFLHSMTSHEHGEVSRLTAVLLLGFFLPQSTGNLFFSTQNLSMQRPHRGIIAPMRRQHHRSNHPESRPQPSGIRTTEAPNNDGHENLVERSIFMSLEERLESSSHRYGNEFGELDDLIVHEHVESAFRSFLRNGLRPFLSGRPVHATEVDLIHVLAMAIHPRPSDQCIRRTTSRLEEQKSDAWEMTKRLMSSLVANSFQLNYYHRVELVEIVLDCLVLPDCRHEAGIRRNAPLFEGAVPHLRASLYAFGMASFSPYDNHLAQCAMVSVAVQSRIDHVVKEEWSRLLHRFVDDRTNCNDDDRSSAAARDDANDDPTTGDRAATALLGTTRVVSRPNREGFRTHTSRGILLRDFLTRCNEARRFADDDFLRYALSSLTDAIEMMVDCCAEEEEQNDGEDENEKEERSGRQGADGGDRDPDGDEKKALSSEQSPLLFASLLNAAKYIFHFILPIKNDEKENEGDDEESEESEDGHSRDMLISQGIQLVHHWYPPIVKEACSMLVLAFSYTEDMWDDYVGAVFDSVVIAIEIAMKGNNRHEGTHAVPIEGLVSVFSQRSLAFATNLFRFLLNTKPEDGNPVVKFRLIAAIANARPVVAQKRKALLVECLKETKAPNAGKHILASILSCRKTHYFADADDSPTDLSSLIASSSLGNWDKYLLSRHAIMTGNFDVAKELYKDLMNQTSSEGSYIWFSAMEKIADGEGRLCSDGAKAIPESTSKLLKASGELRSLQALTRTPCSFQIKLLELRISFLDLLTNIRQLTMEMRLTGAEPKKYTRPNLHLKNAVRLLYKLSIDYMTLYRQHGLFLCQQSRSVLRTLHALCCFVAEAASRVFLETVTDGGTGREAFASGDIAQPLTSLLKQLDSLALEKLNRFVDAKIRAVALQEIMEGILKTPVPVPRSLTCPKALPRATLRLVCDPDANDGDGDGDRLEICPGDRVVCSASGTVPSSLASRSRIPFSTLILRYGLTSKGGSMKSRRIGSGRVSASMSSSGSFFARVKTQALPNEGSYHLEFRLGCRDVRGGEWELPLTEEESHSFTVEVLRTTAK